VSVGTVVKVIDLLAPLAQCGKVAMFGGAGETLFLLCLELLQCGESIAGIHCRRTAAHHHGNTQRIQNFRMCGACRERIMNVE